MDEKRIEEKINQVDGSYRIEGMPLTQENKTLLRDCLTGKKTFNQAAKEMINKHTMREANTR